MARALRLAAHGLYTTQPNPRVGCVIAHGSEVAGEGFHARAGEPHAEAHALHAAAARARGATAYVTLEPCAHHGRTPPCADALLQAGVARVVAACEDPDPRVAGQGLARLRAAGIAVDAGLLREAARELNRGFFSRVERGRPWVRIKLAVSLDGRTALAGGESKWITGAAARADVQHWRACSSAILTGSGTARADDPRLTVRLDPSVLRGDDAGAAQCGGSREDPSADVLQGGEQRTAAPVPPLRVVLDARLDALPPDAHLLDASAPTLILHAADARPQHAGYARAECAALPLRAGRIDLHAALALLAARGCNELQVEAGATLAGALLAHGLADELLLYIAPVLLGDTARPMLRLPPLEAMAARWHLHTTDQRMLGQDWRLLLRAVPRAPHPP